MHSTQPHPPVLVVDDEPFILETTSIILGGLGFEQIYTAENVEEALAQIRSVDPPINLVLSDLNMPDINGVELLRMFHEGGYKGDIILFSGEDKQTLRMAENLAKARKLSILGAISKPLKRDELSELLDKCGSVHYRPERKPSKKVPPEQLVEAIKAGELTPWYQPKVEIASRTIVGVEALVRWPKQDGGMIFPDAFIPVAEEHNLIDDLTFLMLEKSTKQEKRWREQGLHLSIAVNVSMDSLLHLNFPRQVGRYINTTNASQFQLEVTESRLMEDLVGPLDVLLRLRLKKIGLSVDDFGTGHSNLSQLRDLPFDEIKLDRSFVQGATENERSRKILESSVEIAKKLDMRIVAEGIETLQDWRLVEELGCDQMQGYFVSRPLPGKEIPQWIEDWPTHSETLFANE